jgi:hypothetical protein
MIALAQQLAEREFGERLSFDRIRQLLKETGKPIVDGDDEADSVKNTNLTFYRVDMLALAEAILAEKPPVSHSVDVTSGGVVGGKNFGFASLAAVQGLAADDFIVGTSQGEVIRGGIGADQIAGGDGDDQIFGEAGDDRLEGGKANDLIDGGDGTDTAVFRGNRSAYTITFDAANATTTLVSTAEGTDTVRGVEKFEFANLTLDASALIDTTAPTAQGFNPPDGATGVAVAANITVTFSEAVEAGSGRILLKTAAGDLIETFDVATSKQVGINGATVTVNPTADLVHEASYRLEFEAGSVRDLAGNPAAALTSYDFVTALPANYAPSGALAVTGSAQVGKTLTVDTTGLADRDGLGTFAYQWKADGAVIAGAAGEILTLEASQAAKVISVTVSWTDGRGNLESLSSESSFPVAGIQNVAPEIEQAVPALPTSSGATVAGDGNGDGVADAQQVNVTSASLQKQDGSGASVFATLVADSVAGKSDTSVDATITAFQQRPAPVDIPPQIQMPLGLIAFTAVVATVGKTEQFSLYVDTALGVNGYWKQDAQGTWVNLASEPWGGHTTVEGAKTRLDFEITDGGLFDADGLANGTIVDPGAAALMQMSLSQYAPIPPAEGDHWF